MTTEQYVIATRYEPAKGQVIRHAYGPYSTRSRAHAAMKKMVRETELHYSQVDLNRAEHHVVKILTMGDET